jgi:hypothetical protein
MRKYIINLCNIFLKMAKKIRSLLSEIDKKFKESEEGIEIIDEL